MEYERRANEAERIRMEKQTLSDVGELRTQIAVLKEQVSSLQEEIGKLVTRLEFAPVKLLAYGMAGSLLAGIVAALLAQVIKQPQ